MLASVTQTLRPSNDPTVRVNWCEILAERHPNIDWVNTAIWGATATRTELGPWCGVDQVAEALSYNPDLVLIALGTNDLLRLGLEAETVASTLVALHEEVEAGNVTGLVALVPPVLNGDSELAARINHTNELVDAALGLVVDFYSRLEPSDFTQPDGVHFTQSGQNKRAAAAEAVIFGN